MGGVGGMAAGIAEAEARPSGEAKKWYGSNWIRKVRRLSILLRDGFVCCYCGCDLRSASPAEVTLDHLLPRCHGGGNENENLVTACRSCNSSRGDKPWMEYATRGAIDRIRRLRHSPTNPTLAKAIISGEVGDPRVEALR